MKHGYVVPVFEKLPNDERPDETRSAQDKDAGHGPIVCATARFRFIARDDSLDSRNHRSRSTALASFRNSMSFSVSGGVR
jgi:hypothetical protein